MACASTNANGDVAFILRTAFYGDDPSKRKATKRQNDLGRYSPGGEVTLQELPGEGTVETEALSCWMPEFPITTNLQPVHFILLNDGTVLMSGARTLAKNQRRASALPALTAVSPTGELRVTPDFKPILMSELGLAGVLEPSGQLMVRFPGEKEAIVVSKSDLIPGIGDGVRLIKAVESKRRGWRGVAGGSLGRW